MSANWKRWLLSSGVVGGLACGDSDQGGVTLDDGGKPVVFGDSGQRDGGRVDSGTGRDASIRRDGASPSTGDGGEENCGVLMAQIRDFTPDTNPDFETFNGSGATPGIVESTLDANHLPVFKSASGQVTSKTSFDQWYRNVPDVNKELNVEIPNMNASSSLYVYSSSAFFPIDGKGYGNYADSGHNFHFTTQIPTNFTYRGGEVFEFEGDDDLWIFVNDRLALDLGGLHSAVSGTIDFDAQASELGIVKGETYRMDIFHAERHTTQSNFKIRTTIACFTPVLI
jgi:fibro-slime domain-containing protein